TAEMPGFYATDEYDLAGFCVGAVQKERIVDGAAVKAGDALIGIASSGVHSNGFSLVRRVFVVNSERLSTYIGELGKTLGEALLTPTRIYVKPLLRLIEEVGIHAVSHITGGGFYENIPRMLPHGIQAVIRKGSYPLPPVFNIIQNTGKIPEHDMYNTFNMGIGMCVAVAADKADSALRLLIEQGECAYFIGETASGEEGVVIQ
ncbi:MAG: phosphoribosylformylglycinamidine cyclo-ligase, partial [Clostridia bacterium]|nr:phosphoribosylformylglycinamidine cyclo-ligase [Clostridia bacterium]